MRIFLDANVLFSAAQTDGAVRELINRLRAADHRLMADSYVWEEARRNLVARYPSALPAFDALAKRISIVPLRGGDQDLESLPVGDKDKPVLAAAISLNCQVLITGDRTHFGHLFGTAVRGVTIHSPALAARSLLN
ncbi:MAG: PIN domain-containing protein [Spirochaetaceae bacterium]|nr:PIN domain-containing protein [Spirochaetaceae bacterium]